MCMYTYTYMYAYTYTYMIGICVCVCVCVYVYIYTSGGCRSHGGTPTHPSHDHDLALKPWRLGDPLRKANATSKYVQ